MAKLRHRRPDETCNKRDSIINQCAHCVGWEAEDGSIVDEVFRCTATECSLWPYRLTQRAIRTTMLRHSKQGVPHPRAEAIVEHMAKSANRSQALRAFCAECMGLEAGQRRDIIRECVSEGCWLWLHRA